ncbi:MAG TPA: M24 family metallopeptidase [Pseudonocardiaceae bacterium]|nr:M24 family metallopeptidase [Pseudonocardiaceae bacterium]
MRRWRGIRAVKPGRALNVVGRVIESYAKRFGYGVVRDFTAHGIGRATAPASSSAGGQSSPSAWWPRRILPCSRGGRLARLPSSARQRRRRPRRGCGSAKGAGGFARWPRWMWAKRGGRGVRALAARPQRRAAAAVPSKVPRPGRLQPVRVVARCWTSSPSTSRTILPAAGEALRCFEPYGEDPQSSR